MNALIQSHAIREQRLLYYNKTKLSKLPDVVLRPIPISWMYACKNVFRARIQYTIIRFFFRSPSRRGLAPWQATKRRFRSPSDRFSPPYERVAALNGRQWKGTKMQLPQRNYSVRVAKFACGHKCLMWTCGSWSLRQRQSDPSSKNNVFIYGSCCCTHFS